MDEPLGLRLSMDGNTILMWVNCTPDLMLTLESHFLLTFCPSTLGQPSLTPLSSVLM
jgi:hypothetical protein